MHLSQASLITASTRAQRRPAGRRERTDAGLTWTSPLHGQGCNGWIQTTHNTTRRSSKALAQNPTMKQQQREKKKKTLNAAAKAGTDFQLIVQNWNRHTHTRGYSFSNGEYLHAQRALFGARLVPLCSSIADGLTKRCNPPLERCSFGSHNDARE